MTLFYSLQYRCTVQFTGGVGPYLQRPAVLLAARQRPLQLPHLLLQGAGAPAVARQRAGRPAELLPQLRLLLLHPSQRPGGALLAGGQLLRLLRQPAAQRLQLGGEARRLLQLGGPDLRRLPGLPELRCVLYITLMLP